jgi:ERCC4-type nuclease|tara:strand:+ start:82 stop:567 length:486 start_codon:yes stop_codon:yes gene_type:complete
MAKKRIPNFTVIKDTREQEGYHFSKYDKCEGMIERKLDTGDYSIEGLEEKICVERKASPEELATNLGQKKHAFMNEIERMKPFRHKFILLEFSLQDLVDFPEGSRIPESQKAKVKISGKYMLKMLMEFQIKHNIHVVFCGNKYNAFLTLMSLFKRINEMYN